MSDILIIQNARYEGPAVLGELLRLDGFDISMVLEKRERIPAIDSCAIVILGAPESANDDLPYLKEELNLIIESVRKNIPVHQGSLWHKNLSQESFLFLPRPC